jgi:hypothetical protein
MVVLNSYVVENLFMFEPMFNWWGKGLGLSPSPRHKYIIHDRNHVARSQSKARGVNHMWVYWIGNSPRISGGSHRTKTLFRIGHGDKL